MNQAKNDLAPAPGLADALGELGAIPLRPILETPVVRDVQAPDGPVVAAMVERWGSAILQVDGSLDRQAVADIVFADTDELTALNAIVHPAVADEMTARRQALAGSDATVILDIPLLTGAGYEGLGGVVVVDVDPELAVERLVEHRGFTEDDARNRIASQMAREDRLALADFVVDNSGTPADLAAEVDRCWAWIATLERPPTDQPVQPLGQRAADS